MLAMPKANPRTMHKTPSLEDRVSVVHQAMRYVFTKLVPAESVNLGSCSSSHSQRGFVMVQGRPGRQLRLTIGHILRSSSIGTLQRESLCGVRDGR